MEYLNCLTVVCVLNAETIKDPYNNARKDLVKLIKEHGTVEYIKSAFSDAERTTEVEIALVHLKKDKDSYKSIFQGFEDTLSQDYQAMFTKAEDSEIVKKGNTETLLTYNKLMKKQIVETTISRAKLGHYIKTLGVS